MPVGDMIRRSADKFPGKTALIFKDKRITYGELNERVNALANRLLDMGGGKGDRVAVLLHNWSRIYRGLFCLCKVGRGVCSHQ